MEKYIVFSKYGVNRKGILVVCPICGNEFPTRVDQASVCCSVACRNKHSQKRVLAQCATCECFFEKKPSSLKNSKSGIYFCTRLCKDMAQKIGGIKEIMPAHYGHSRGKHLFKEIFRKNEPICVGCGEKRRFLLCVHHIDRNRGHNILENLEIVCGNCHMIRHLKEKDGEIMYDLKSISSKELIDKAMRCCE